MDMVGRVARAIADKEWIHAGGADSTVFGEPSWTYKIDLARAAIAAMREPTIRMAAAGAAKMFYDDETAIPDIYTTMIDAALTPEP